MSSNEDRIRQFISTEKLRYQSLDLPGDVKTPGHDRSYLNDIIFDEDFRGRTLLDIGSYLGYFCLEALKRGGAAATGIEPDRESVRQARELAELLSITPEYICGDFERHDWGDRTFDTVLCLNVLHHLLDPLHALKTMMRLARRRILIEFKTLSFRDLQFGWFNPLLLAARGSAYIQMARPKVGDDIAGRSYLFTPNALKMLFDSHTTAFEPVRIGRSPFKGRHLLDARKRDIGHLLVVSGPTSGGKSTFSQRLTEDAGLRRCLGIADGDWTLIKSGQVNELPTGRQENVLLMYGLMRPYRQAIRTIERDPVAHVFDVCDRISFITLITPLDRLRRQISDREVSRLAQKLGDKWTKDVFELYRGNNASPVLRGFYEEWFTFCERFRAKTVHDLVVVNHGESYEPVPRATWRESFDRLCGPKPSPG